ncbi:MAG: HisA/HisF-related TIM barrel protein [Thermomicrobiales bacterium]
MIDVVERTADQVFIPLTVGGGIRSTDDMKQILRAGADKVSLNTAAIARPELISEGADIFGRQCIVVAIDARRNEDGSGWGVYTHGGRKPAGLDAVAWAARAAGELGAGELPRHVDGSRWRKEGYDLELLEAIGRAVSVPVIASGGAGNLDHMVERWPLVAPMQCSPRRSSTSASTGFATPAGTCERPAFPCARCREKTWREHHGPLRLGFVAADSGGRAGSGVASGAHGRLHEPRGLETTAATGRVTFFSRSRNTLWTKGETSGNVLTVRELRINCEENSLLVFADPTGPTCHTVIRVAISGESNRMDH